jgi:hypothetical protein
MFKKEGKKETKIDRGKQTYEDESGRPNQELRKLKERVEKETEREKSDYRHMQGT